MNLEQLTFSSEEKEALTSIIGQELLEVKYDSWSAELLFNDKGLTLTPDEIDIPTESNQYGDIVTLRIEIRDNSILDNKYSEILDCGKVKNVWTLESSVEIESPYPVEESDLVADIKAPAGMVGIITSIIPLRAKKKVYTERLWEYR